MGTGGDHRPERAEETHVESTLHQLVGLVLDTGDLTATPRVVDEDVDAAERRHGVLDHRLALAALPHIGADERSGGTELVGHRPTGCLVDLADDDLRSLAREHTGDACADAVTGSRDDGDPPVQLPHVCVPFVLSVTFPRIVPATVDPNSRYDDAGHSAVSMLRAPGRAAR